ncbi:metallophosphoesterase [Belliella sp. DSM 111904]|uniref:Metallophosphoesterase n=1 Tax=Belliella filtrata TaxID=2923435 RepID=A0ABS9V1G6_9BACT|nr:fibronectin type III domain-containing protein [Belliella filtrata]MCH7410262.1 metallophosphoesterase [Belliella filtrata]
MKFKQFTPFASLILSLFFTLPLFAQSEPYGFYLTWVEDPTSTMVVDWHSDDTNSTSLEIRRKGTSNWALMESDVLPYPFSDRSIHRVSLQMLRTDTAYEIKFPGSDEIYYFRTMPKNINEKPIKIAIGGDAMHNKEWLEKTNTVVASYDPDFIIIGGDMAYENGLAENVGRIYDFFDSYKKTLITKDNRILPCLVAVGNHEVVGGTIYQHDGYEQTDEFRRKISPYFYALFPFPGQPGYNTMDFGKYLSLIILDTDHSNPILGKQTAWLEETLQSKKDFLHTIPVYHVPAFPSVREFDGKTQTIVRENWVPIFEKHDVRIAFENHDHAYKRTYPIRDGQRDQSGIVYVGDGSWGVGPREIHDVSTTWYLKEAASINAFTLLTIEGRQFSLISVDIDGNVIDSYPETPKPNTQD